MNGATEHEAKVKVFIDLQDKVKNLNSKSKDGKDEMKANATGQVKAIIEEKRSLQNEIFK